MKGLRGYALLVVLAAGAAIVVLLAMSWGSAASNAKNAPTDVAETNTDLNGNIRVHEQGTASVTVMNASLPVHEQGTATVNVVSPWPLAFSAIVLDGEVIANELGMVFSRRCRSAYAGSQFDLW